MKIAIYAIAKNEAAVAERWAKNGTEADYRVVLDTGSTDQTVEILQRNGVIVHQARIDPWRFDTARNGALQKVPADVDVCISLDLDEVLRPGWRQGVEAAWTNSTTLLRHPLYPKWSAEESKPIDYFGYVGRVHARHGYFWKYAIHEILRPEGAHVETFTDEVVIEHQTDHSRSKELYGTMLRELVDKEPREPRYAFFMGVELFNRGNYLEALKEFNRYLLIAPGTLNGERAYVLRVMARTSQALCRGPAERLNLLHKATAEAPDEREVWCDLAQACADIGNWPNCLSAAVNALRVTDPHASFQVDFIAWRGLPEKLFHQSATQLGIPEENIKTLLLQVTK